MLAPAQLLDLAVTAFDIDINSGVQLWAAQALLAVARTVGLPAAGEAVGVASYAETQGLGAYTPPVAPFPLTPITPAIIWWKTDSPDVAGRLATLLTTRYPPTHPVGIAGLDPDGTIQEQQTITLSGLSQRSIFPFSFFLFHLPALPIAADRRGADGLAWIVARLLGPGGCPWDVKQTHQSLRGALLEETHEVLEALDAGDMAGLSEELGDLLISIFSHSEMARQAGHFDLGDVLGQVTTKLIRRHPHVFGSLAVDGEGAVVQNWEQIKAAELAEKGRTRASVLDGVPPALPSLAAAQKLAKKAGQVGFAWRSIDQVWDKLDEELGELRAATGPAAVAEEYGDVLFVLAVLARWLGLDAEAALRSANAKFRRRFTHLEQVSAAQSRPLSDMNLEELLALWREAKAL